MKRLKLTREFINANCSRGAGCKHAQRKTITDKADRLLKVVSACGYKGKPDSKNNHCLTYKGGK